MRLISSVADKLAIASVRILSVRFDNSRELKLDALVEELANYSILYPDA